MPYLLVGYDFRLVSADAGVSSYYYHEKSEKTVYPAPDGSEKVMDDAAFYLNRFKSHVLVNLRLRLLPEDGFHIKLRIGRENFIPTDSLFNLCFIYPFDEWNLLDLTIASASFDSYFLDEVHTLRSNQRFNLRYEHAFGLLKVGLTLSSLFNNEHGGGGSIPLWNRLGAGLDLRTCW